MNYLICTRQRLDATARAAPLILSDEAIDFWAGVYLENPRYSMLGISFEAFLSQPHELMYKVHIDALTPLVSFAEVLHLLPAQRAVRESLDAHDAGQIELELGVSEARLHNQSPVVHDGVLVEKLRHRAWPRRAREHPEVLA